MANAFIGLTMVVTMASPVGGQLRGQVTSIEAGKSLTLRNVVCPANGRTVDEYTIQAADIIELVEAPRESTLSPKITPPQPQRFEDPAILSMGRKPAASIVPDADNMPLYKTTPILRADSARTVREDRALKDSTPVSSLVEPMAQLQSSLQEMGDTDAMMLSELEAKHDVSPIQPANAQRKKRSRRKNHTRKAGEESADLEVIPARETVRSKGWRQTPLLEPTSSFQPFATLKKRARGNGRMDDSGWATEDATDVQDLGDFDFQGSLAKFDKHTIFHQLQAKDSVAAEDRLVAHNRLPRPKPGTAGGKNLHHSEMVLQSPTGSHKHVDRWRSEAGESDFDGQASHKDAGTGSGRHSRKAERADSRVSAMRHSVSRKGSGNAAPPTRSHSVPETSKASFYVVPSNRRCEPISALQMLNLETIADHDLGFTEDMMTENAGRGIAEVALSALNSSSALVRSSNSMLNVAIFAGNNKSGLRAVAAGRHLRNHNLNVVICVLGIEHEGELLAGLRRQMKVFRSFGGKLLSKAAFMEDIKTWSSSIDLIIDGLLGLTISFEELRLGDQTTAFELIEFANRGTVPVLAIDVPTGIDPTSGKINVIDGRQLYLHARFIVAMGAPKKGLLEAMNLGEGTATDSDGSETRGGWQLFVADLGLGNAVWKRAGTRMRRGIEFDGSWVLGIRFQAGLST